MTEHEIPEAPDEVPGRHIGWVLAATAMSVIVAAVIVWVLEVFDITGGGESRAEYVDSVPPSEPFSLDMNAPLGLEGTRAEQRKALDGYSWADAAHTRVRLPVDTAIDRYVGGGK